MAENFLVFSPRVQYRDPGLIFVEITSTSHLFGGENYLLREASSLAKDFFPEAQLAIADTPAAAQLFSEERPQYIVRPNEELTELNDIPLFRLPDLEGLTAWRSPKEVHHIVDFFSSLGIQKIGQLKQFEIDSLRERWNETGSILWKRLHGLDRQVISPLVPTESLEDYVHMDFPLSHLPLLLHSLSESFKKLFLRLEGRKEFASKIVLQLFCEYSGHCHLIELRPNSPSRNQELYLKLLENKLVEVCLDNPIKEFKIEVLSAPEKVQQMDFWGDNGRHHGTNDGGIYGESYGDKMDQISSLLKQASLSSGFFHPKDEIFPENSWEILEQFEEANLMEDVIEVEGQGLRLLPSYSKSLSDSPRPSRLLGQAKRLSKKQVESLQFLSSQPIERLEGHWWEDSRGRDYFYAMSPKGQFLWVYFDRIEAEYFLHGYFD